MTAVTGAMGTIGRCTTALLAASALAPAVARRRHARLERRVRRSRGPPRHDRRLVRAAGPGPARRRRVRRRARARRGARRRRGPGLARLGLGARGRGLGVRRAAGAPRGRGRRGQRRAGRRGHVAWRGADPETLAEAAFGLSWIPGTAPGDVATLSAPGDVLVPAVGAGAADPAAPTGARAVHGEAQARAPAGDRPLQGRRAAPARHPPHQGAKGAGYLTSPGSSSPRTIHAGSSMPHWFVMPSSRAGRKPNLV